MVHTVYLGLGSNLGDREATILKAYEEIERLIGVIRRRSAFYYSEPWGFESAHAFVNTVVMVETSLTPRQLLRRTQQIERLLGKTKAHATEKPRSLVFSSEKPRSLVFSSEKPRSLVLSSEKPRSLVFSSNKTRSLVFSSKDSSSRLPIYHDRPIDIDILLYDDLTIDQPDLKIPHPLMQERPFVMQPLNEVKGKSE